MAITRANMRTSSTAGISLEWDAVAVIALPVVVLLATPRAWPPWSLMCLLIAAIFLGLKWLTWRRAPARMLHPWRDAGYWFAWPGLDANAFLAGRPMEDLRPTAREWLAAALKLTCGAAIFAGAGLLVPTGNELLLGWVAMTGFILALHFGFFHLMSCAWRAYGINAQPSMNRPL